MLRGLARHATCIVLQETHGAAQEVKKLLFPLSREFFFHHSIGPDRSTGGTIILIARTYVREESQMSSEDVVSGRVTRSVITDGGPTVTVWNVHNYGLSNQHVSLIATRIKRDIMRARADPLKHVVWICGDSNFLATGETPFTVNDPLRKRDAQAATTEHRPRRAWSDALKDTVECQQDLPTHYNSGSDSYARLDRIYTTLPPWALVNSNCTARVPRDPRSLHTAGVSDHGPVQVNFSCRKSLPKQQRAIPRDTFELPGFKAAHDKLVEAARLHELPPVTRWQLHKLIIREAALLARDEQCQSSPESPYAVHTTLTAVSRAVWLNDVRLGKLLIDKSALARQHLEVVAGSVRLLQPVIF